MKNLPKKYFYKTESKLIVHKVKNQDLFIFRNNPYLSADIILIFVYNFNIF